ncbi:MAG TPA: prepilin-type N-terminal cleavage/methylation domain-containing protein [Thermoleophilaceae bacterium]
MEPFRRFFPSRRQAGFTLVETMASISVLLVGLLGTVAMVDGANRSTAATRAREGSTNLSRDVIESVRTVPFTTLAQGNVTGSLQLQPGLADADQATAGWQVVRREVTYTLAVTVCTVDDPEDGIGAHAAGGFCSDPAVTNPPDANPADLKRVAVTATWRDELGAHSSRQATLISTSDRGPGISSLNTSPANTTTVTSGTSLAFAATSTGSTANVEWFLDGVYQSSVVGSGSAWSFNWALGSPPGSPLAGTTCGPDNTGALDGSYFVGVKAYDAASVTSGPRVLTVSLNRCPPLAPAGLMAGRTRLWSTIELQWDAAREDDVVGYAVYRDAQDGNGFQRVNNNNPNGTTCSGTVIRTYCSEPDSGLLSGKNVSYKVAAVDRSPSGALREGSLQSVTVVARTNNDRPGTPAIASGGTASTLTWAPTTDPDNGDAVDFYRIYRDGSSSTSYRYDVVDNSGSPVVWTDPNPSGGPHAYYVTAVDTHLMESTMSGSVTR